VKALEFIKKQFVSCEEPVKLTKEQELRLIFQARQGSESAARELVERHQQRLFAFVWKVVRNADEAEDICQETFLRAMTNLNDFNEDYRFSTWIFTIGYRLALNYLKHRTHQNGFDFSNTAGANQQNEVDAVIQSEYAKKVREVIWEEVDNLTTAQKATILMFYRQGLSCQEISEALDMPVATVKSHMHRAREKLREKLLHQRVDGSDLGDLKIMGA
jgi:RNA polymerase sigma-70 factor (ECF subfamily)